MNRASWVRRSWLRWCALGASVAIATALGATASTSATAAPAVKPVVKKAPTECNGHAELCARRFNQVALAGTHNSYAQAGAGFSEPAEGRTVAEQLDDGIRAFMLDVYQGTPTTDPSSTSHVCTDPTPLKVTQLTGDLGKATVDALIAQRNLVCPAAGGPTSALYLCHNFCELGATPLADPLTTFRTFLDAHPTEVVALILEDYVTGSQVATEFETAGLTKRVYTHKLGAPWPTLGAMVKAKQQLVVFSEHGGGTPRWYLPAFKEMQDTPYTFQTAAQFSCAPNRGPAQAPLFLVNHWLASTDVPGSAEANAATVNPAAVLGPRVEQCEQQRGQIPNIVAVEFAETGDLLTVVDRLNEVATSQ